LAVFCRFSGKVFIIKPGPDALPILTDGAFDRPPDTKLPARKIPAG
jgi:hypothetical protein